MFVLKKLLFSSFYLRSQFYGKQELCRKNEGSTAGPFSSIC